MLKGILNKVVGDPNERAIQKLQPMVDAINELEPQMEQRTEAELAALTGQFRTRLMAGETLDDLLTEAYAAVREVAKRTVDMRPFDVQLIGGIVLHQGKVAEMRTGEGKTLVATMPVYLNALAGRGTHLVTVNDYLARRDALWMGPIYHLMGLGIGLLQSGAEQPAYLYDPSYERDPYPGLRPVPRREAYAADITYGTNNEFGFDYLRDNLALSLDRRVQRPLYYAIVDEVDNIFIDEARTPLIISGPSGEPVEEYSRFAAIARQLEPEVHYELEEKERAVYLTDAGLAVVEQETGIENIYDEANYRYVHYMQQALKAQVLYLEGRDYIRRRKQIILIDQHTGRLMPNRRLSEGLHQAIEAKENVPIRPRDVTSATVTIQNYFRMYEKLAGMSGTALTEAEEFFKIYNLDVLAIPTNRPVIRADHSDVVYRSEEAKFRAVAREILSRHSQGQPVLVGTTSVEMSERLSNRLTGERLQMAALAPRIAYALLDAELERDERASLRETMNDSLETMNSVAWRRLARDVGVDPNVLSDQNQEWIADYLDIPHDSTPRQAMERALRDGIDHEILNAKEHTREAAIIARAGEPGSVTIATNMAGRGVDIKLGGELSDEIQHRAHQVLESRGLDPFAATPAQMNSAIAEVLPQYAKRRQRALDAGGLFVLGTERHEARRIDNQLRGRSGRQGEPGASRFYLSLEDDLMRRFGRKEMLSKLMEQIGDDFPIEHNLVSRTIERAQTSVEGYNFDIRKHLLEYDDVLNRQRETIYDERLRILKSEDLRSEMWRMVEGQVDEYVEKLGEEPDDYRVLFAGLDDVLPLILPAPKSPFQGPLSFAGHLTAFPPFTIAFLSDQLAGQPLESVRDTLAELPHLSATSYGEQVRQTVAETAQAILEKYDERLARFGSLLDEKIEDYLQLLEERGQSLDPRRLVQHLERTYPLRLTMPAGDDLAEIQGLDDLRDYWLDEVDVEFHRQTITGLVERAQIRLPMGVRLDRVRPARVPADRLADELRRVAKAAAREAVDDEAQNRLERALPESATTRQVLAFVTTVKDSSTLDYGRLDRLVGHVLGAYLDELIERYAEAAGEDEVRLRRDLERLRESIVEGKKGGRNSLEDFLKDLNELVHLEIPTLEELLSLAVGHEYDKWAQRQLQDIQTDIKRNPLEDTRWATVAQHLMVTHYTQQQAYDRGHQRRATWAPRLPFSFLAQAYVQDTRPEALRPEILDTLQEAIDQREGVWGQQEFKRWSHLSLTGLEGPAADDLVTYLGQKELGDHQDQAVEDLPPHLYDHLRFILSLHQLEDRNPRLRDLPQAGTLRKQLAEELENRVLHTPLGELDEQWQARIRDQLARDGLLDDPAAQASMMERLVDNWDPDTQEEVARFLGQQALTAQRGQIISQLDPEIRQIVVSYLDSRRRFVDEERVQEFLVHQQLGDLGPEISQAALSHLARSRMERLSRRKIANLDVSTRDVVIDSLQQSGLFTDTARRDALLNRTLSELEPEILDGLQAFLGRQEIGEQRLGDLEPDLQRRVIGRLKQVDALSTADAIEETKRKHLSELSGEARHQVEDALTNRLRQDLAGKTMEELASQTRRQIHQVLEARNHFIDSEKVGWYEGKTLAQLPADLLRGLEIHLGQRQMTTIQDVPFLDLPADTRNMLQEFFDSDSVFEDRAERLRLTQTGSLGDLPPEKLEMVAKHVGRQTLVRLRNQRPPGLKPADREAVWTYLRSAGHFTDEFKEELFAYQRLEEFDTQTQQAVEAALTAQLIELLDTTPIDQLPEDIQATVFSQLRQADYFVDPDLLEQVETQPVGSLPPALGNAVASAVGATLLEGKQKEPISDLPEDARRALWQYLNEIGYFVDEDKRNQILDRRLADLSSEVYEQAVSDFAAQLAGEVLDRPVSELDENLRQGLREAVEAQGYFESDVVRAQVLDQSLGSLRREDLEAIADALGKKQLDRWAGQRLADLPDGNRQAVLAHLQAAEWFLDRERLAQLPSQRLVDLDSEIQQDLVQALCQQEVDYLLQQRVSALGKSQRETVYQILRQQGMGLDEGAMRPYRRQPLRDLEGNVYRRLLQDLGGQAVQEWGATKFQDLDQDSQRVLSVYLGRRIMSRIEQRVLLHTISRLWIDYLTDIEDLRRGIGLEAFGQRDPLVEYKRRAFELFEELGDNIRRIAVRSLFRQSPAPLAPE